MTTQPTRSPAELQRADADFLWHPYAPHPAPYQHHLVTATDGVFLELADGRRVIDGMSSWWAACHGHGHPALVAAAHEQIDRMSHVMFGGLTHEPAVALATELLEIAPAGLDEVFFADSGSIAVEVALKMALQAQRSRGETQRTKVLTWRGGYHGDTYHAMSVCDPDGGMHALWRASLPAQVFCPAPPARGASEAEISDYLALVGEAMDSRIAAMIIEPIVQGAGGMTFHDPQVVAGVARLAKEKGVFLIVDEIATGFGRIGELFACDVAGISPDILCLGKALTGGFMSFAAVLATREIAELVSSPAGGGALMHGPTFMANPLACAVALAAVRLARSNYWQPQVAMIQTALEVGLASLADNPEVADVRVLGAIGVVQLHQGFNSQEVDQIQKVLLAQGVWLRPFGTLLYCMPPFICTKEQISQITEAMAAAVAELHQIRRHTGT